MDATSLEQRRRCRVGQRKTTGIDRAAHPQRELGPLLKGDVQLSAQQGRAQGHGQAARHVAEPARDVDLLQRQAQRAFAAFAERRGHGRRFEAAAVEREGEQRLDAHLSLRRQRADERHGQLERAQLVGGLHRCVGEVGAAVREHDVVHGEACRLRAARLFGEPGQDVVDIEAAFGHARQAQLGRVDLEPVDHRREAQQRLEGRVGMQAAHAQQRGCRYVARGIRARAGDDEVVQRELERPRVEGDGAEAHAAAELLAGDALGLLADQRRCIEPGRAPQQHEAEQHGCSDAQSARRSWREAVLRCSGRLIWLHAGIFNRSLCAAVSVCDRLSGRRRAAQCGPCPLGGQCA